MKQGELAKELGKTPMEIGRLRKKLCTEDEYDESTKMLSASGIKKIQDYCDDLVIQPQFVKVRVLEFANNPKFVICRTLEGTKSKKARVCIPANIKSSLRVNHVFNAQVINFEDQDYYRHEKLTNGNYPAISKKA
jgi:hypothetical protein